MNSDREIKIIGFDLGHGETALTWVRAGNQDNAPQSLLINNKKSQITAIAYHPQKGVLLGDLAFQASDSSSFEIAFKSRRFDDKAYQKVIKEFVSAVFQQLIDTQQIQAEEQNIFFVGCPSGWWQEEIATYKQLLEECLPNVTVVKESRAALMHAKESGIFTIQELAKSVLVIDIGSSTTDYTLVEGMSNIPIDFGYDLGASLIDKAILLKTIECHRQYREGKEEILHLGEYLSDEEIWQLDEITQLEKIFAQTYPAIYDRFNDRQFRDQLIKREDQGKYFWELRSCKYWQEFEQPKVILSVFMDKATFAFDREDFFHNNALHLIAGVDEYVVAILNSSCGWWYLKSICTDLQNGYLQAYREKLEQIPIPYVSEEDKEIIKSLVQKCLDAKGQGVEQWESQINERVANLYGLTADEMKIIRENI